MGTIFYLSVAFLLAMFLLAMVMGNARNTIIFGTFATTLGSFFLFSIAGGKEWKAFAKAGEKPILSIPVAPEKESREHNDSQIQNGHTSPPEELSERTADRSWDAISCNKREIDVVL